MNTRRAATKTSNRACKIYTSKKREAAKRSRSITLATTCIVLNELGKKLASLP